MLEILARGWANLIARLDGPLHFRFIVQPLVAMLLGARAALREAREPRLEQRRDRVRRAARDVRTVFLVSVVLDAVYQIRVHVSIFALELLVTSALLAIVPYAIVHEAIVFLASRAGARDQARVERRLPR
jgi:hypothetical protein